MSPLRIEVFSDATDRWAHIDEIRLGDRDGTVSDNHAGGRDVYMFGVDPVSNQGYVKKSTGGVEDADHEIRIVDPSDFETIVVLAPDESYELTVNTDKSPKPRKLRFTYFE